MSIRKVSQGASIRCLNDWISGFVAPLPELWNRLGLSGRGHFLTANSRGPRCCCYYCSLRSQRGPCSQQIHRDPLSPDFSGTWHASSWFIMIHHDSSWFINSWCVFGSNTLRVRVFDLRSKRLMSRSQAGKRFNSCYKSLSSGKLLDTCPSHQLVLLAWQVSKRIVRYWYVMTYLSASTVVSSARYPQKHGAMWFHIQKIRICETSKSSKWASPHGSLKRSFFFHNWP